jgi:hypothetical protein
VAVFKLSAAEQAPEARVEPVVERRGADRAKNVTRLPVKARPAPGPKAAAAVEPRKTGTDDEWSEF